MKLLLTVFISSTVCILSGLPMYVNAQEETILARVRFSEETVKLADYPLQTDPSTGLSSTRLGEGSLYQADLTLVEIPPEGQTPADRHLAEEVIYIISGQGYTMMWTRPGVKPQRYDWSAGDLISPSLNTWHQHFNSSTDAPARYVSMTSTPLTQNLFHNLEFLSSSDFVFEDRWEQGLRQQPQYKMPNNIDMRAGHFIPDLPGRELQAKKGSRGITIRPDGGMAGNHILQTLVREYQGAPLLPLDGHTHPWEVVYLVLEGEGATLLKNGDEPARLVNWEKGDMYIVRANEYHDNGARVGSSAKQPYPRLMQMRPSGYFFGVGNVGEEDHSPINLDE